MQYIYLLKTIKDWMMVWIERCQHFGHRLKWESMSSLVIKAHCNGDPNATQKEIYLVYGLKDLHVFISLLINHMFLNSWWNNLYIFDIIVGEIPQDYVL